VKTNRAITNMKKKRQKFSITFVINLLQSCYIFKSPNGTNETKPDKNHLKTINFILIKIQRVLTA